MAIDKKKKKAMTVYVPRKIIKELEEYHASEGRPSMSGSSMIVNILQRWYDERAAQKEPAKERIGEGLVRLGKMTPAQAEEVLRLQREKYKFTKRFGEIAIELMFINRETLDEYLGDA